MAVRDKKKARCFHRAFPCFSDEARGLRRRLRLDPEAAVEGLALFGHLAQKYGKRFAPPALLREMAEKGETFYGRFGVKAKAAA